MKRFLFNCSNPRTPAGEVCITGLAKLLQGAGHQVGFNQWDGYDAYDYVIFMGYESRVAEARTKNPAIKVGLGDPKVENQQEAALADFLLVSSVEQHDLFLSVNPNCFIYYMFPEMPCLTIQPRQREKTVIGYHGNKVHLDALFPRVTSALERLSRKRPVELRVIYNVRALGRWAIGRRAPFSFPVTLVQWSPEALVNALSDADIGIVPNDIPLRSEAGVKRSSYGWRKIFLENERDYVIRFKYSSNPGRIYVFERLGIPVVADFFPSAAQFLEHGKRGFLAHSVAGWERSLSDLADSPTLRGQLAGGLRTHVEANYNREQIFRNFLSFLDSLRPTPASAQLPPLFERSEIRYHWEILQELIRRAISSLKRKLGLPAD